MTLESVARPNPRRSDWRVAAVRLRQAERHRVEASTFASQVSAGSNPVVRSTVRSDPPVRMHALPKHRRCGRLWIRAGRDVAGCLPAPSLRFNGRSLERRPRIGASDMREELGALPHWSELAVPESLDRAEKGRGLPFMRAPELLLRVPLLFGLAMLLSDLPCRSTIPVGAYWRARAARSARGLVPVAPAWPARRPVTADSCTTR